MTTAPDNFFKPNGDASVQVLEIGARIARGPSKRLVATAFQAELTTQLSLFEALSQVDLAHTVVMSDNGIIPQHVG